MAKFHSLIVTDVENTIRDAIVVSLKPEDNTADFDFTQGQYLTFRQVIEGTETVSYTHLTLPTSG